MTPNNPNNSATQNTEAGVANLLVDGFDLAVDGVVALAQGGCAVGGLALEGAKCAAEAGVGLLASLLP